MKSEFKLYIDAPVGVFYDDGEDGFFLPILGIKRLTPIKIVKELTLRCMFSVFMCEAEGQRCGFYFASQFKVSNEGGYLITYMNRRKEATEVETLIKTPELILYHYPNKGTLAISPKVNDEINTVFLEQ